MPMNLIIPMKILITGGAGFIGRDILEAFTRRAKDRYRIDILDTDEAIFSSARYMSSFNRFIRTSDISKLKGYDYIIHAAAISDSRCKDIKSLMEVNYGLTCKLADHREKHGGRMIYFSSASVYGDKKCDEGATEFDPQTPYAVSKLLAEKELLGRDGYCIVRPFNVYGQGECSKAESTRSILYRIAHAAAGLSGIEIFDSSSTMRDFVSSIDVSESIVDIVEWDIEHQAKKTNSDIFDGHHIFNLGRGKSISIDELVRTAVYAVGHSSWMKLGENPYKGSYQSTSCAIFSHQTRPYDPAKFRDPQEDLIALIRYLECFGEEDEG